MAWHGFHFFWWAFQRLLLISIWESFAYLWTSSNIQAFVFFSSVCPLWKDVLWDNQGSWFGFLFCQWGPALVKELLQTTNHHKSLHLGQTSISSSLNPPPAKSIFWSTRRSGGGQKEFLVKRKCIEEDEAAFIAAENCIKEHKSNKSYTVECLHAIQFCWMAKGEIWYGWWSSQIKASSSPP